MENTNILSLFVSSCIPLLVGYIYYSKNLAGNAWRTIFNAGEKHISPTSKIMVIVISLIMSFFLSFFLLDFNNGPGQEGDFDTFAHGAWHGCFIAIIIGMPFLFMNGLFEFKKIKVLFINFLYWLISLALMGGIIDAMNHWPN